MNLSRLYHNYNEIIEYWSISHIHATSKPNTKDAMNYTYRKTLKLIMLRPSLFKRFLINFLWTIMITQMFLINHKRTYYLHIVFMITNWNSLKKQTKMHYLKIEFIHYQATNSNKSKNIWTNTWEKDLSYLIMLHSPHLFYLLKNQIKTCDFMWIIESWTLSPKGIDTLFHW